MKKNLLKKIRELFILIVIIPLVFFLLVEGVIRLSGIDTDVVKSKKFKIGIPMWAHDDVNFVIAGDMYSQILDNELPVESAEWLNYFCEAKYVRYKMKPNVSVVVANSVNRLELEKGVKIHLKSNSQGFRTREIPFRKPKNVYRIVFLGDSTTFGWGVNQNERFSRYLEEILNSSKQKIRYETINLGMPGYTSSQGVSLFNRYVLKYSPDMVILSFGANDARKVPKRIKKQLKPPGWIKSLKNVLVNFKTYRLIRKILLSMTDPLDRPVKREAVGEQKVPLVTVEEFSQNLRYIIDQGKKRGISTVLLGLCCPIDYLAKMSVVGKKKGVVMMDGMHAMMKKIRAIEEGKRFSKLSQYYRDLYGNDVIKERRLLYVTSDTCHPNIIGHKIIAQALFKNVFQGDNPEQKVK
jgi:lysophospholipase L1-like esterase